MNCEILRSLYLRSNGEIPCNCAAGERINLGWSLGEKDWDISKVFENENYATIRESFEEGKAPWGKVCENCAFFVPDETMDDQIRERKRLEYFHVEPSLACALRCPGCSRADQVKRRKTPFALSDTVFGQTLSSLSKNNYEIGYFFYCGQGEPLNHPRFQELATLAHKYYPSSRQIVTTNGNHAFEKVFDKKKYIPDQFVVSVDGLDQESYEKYRVRGDVATALDFMRDLKKLPNPPVVEWKYILFVYNDSDEEIRRAQEKALELGVDRIMFVLTHTQERSKRFTIDNIDELNLLPGVGYHTMTPHLSYKKEVARLVDESVGCCDEVGSLEFVSVARNSANLGILQGLFRSPEIQRLGRLVVSLNGSAVGTVEFTNAGKKENGYTFTLTKKDMPAELEEYRLDCELIDLGGQSVGSWNFRYSFDESRLHKRTERAV